MDKSKDKYIVVTDLKEIIKKKGYRINYIYGELGISRQAFYQKCDNVIKWKRSEVEYLIEKLGVSWDDFA